MAQTSGSDEPRTATEQSSYAHESDPPGPLDRAWVIVGTTAGVVFIVALLFFAGLFMARATNGPSTGQQRPDQENRSLICRFGHVRDVVLTASNTQYGCPPQLGDNGTAAAWPDFAAVSR